MMLRDSAIDMLFRVSPTAPLVAQIVVLARVQWPCQIHKMDMHPELLLAARSALGLTREELALEAGIGERTLADIEGGRRGSVETYLLVQRALEERGIVFLPASEGEGPGMRLPSGWRGSEIVTPRKTRRGSRKAKPTS